MRRPLALALALLCAPARASAPGDGWELVLERGGAHVYARSVPGSPVHGVRGDAVVDQPLRRLVWVMLDCPRATQWVDRLQEERIVRRLGPGEFIEYDRVGMPPLVSDREFVSRVTVRVAADRRAVEIESHSVEDPAVPRGGPVRGEIRYSITRLTAVDATHTRLELETHADPKGWLPGWLVNFFQRRWPVESFDAMRKQAARPDLTPPAGFEELLDGL